MESKLVSIKSIRIPKKHRRINAQDDIMIYNSLKTEGQKEPVILIQGNKEYILADGSRRVKAARKLKWKNIKATIHEVPEDMVPESYAAFIRVSVNHHRQGFYPSQRAHYLKILNKKYGVSIDEIAEACGVSTSSAKGWMAVNDCSEEIQMFIDDGKFPVDSGRYIRVLKPAGQMIVTNTFRDRPRVTLSELRKLITKIRHKHPEYIKVGAAPAKSKVRRKKDKREVKSYARFRNLSLHELESKIESCDKEITFMKREIIRARPIIQQICSKGKLRLALPGDTLRKFDLFLAEKG